MASHLCTTNWTLVSRQVNIVMRDIQRSFRILLRSSSPGMADSLPSSIGLWTKLPGTEAESATDIITQ